MDFKNRLKGTVTQTLIKALLEDAGYKVVPLGVEEVIREVATLSQDEYFALGLPQTLRKMPDFFVTDPSHTNSWLIEVKYRKSWDKQTRDRLGQQIKEQIKHWQPVYLMVFLGRSTRDGNELPSYSMRVVKTVYRDGRLLFLKHQSPFSLDGREQDECVLAPWSELEWNNFSRIQDTFRLVANQWEEQTIMKAMQILRSLPDLDLFI
jgi:hypothetical protein